MYAPNQQGYSPRRFFKVLDPHTGELRGRYTGSTPKQAAAKAASQLFHQYGNESFRFAIQESSRGCDKKQYAYEAQRIPLTQSHTVTIGDQTVTYLYRNQITPVHDGISPQQAISNPVSGLTVALEDFDLASDIEI
ncbi:Hypothetical protein MVR_LOCUS259 [uncultured virus]|nr:Hypothetical protein MVR_LOCUS259 [uncultured virus]